MIILDILMCLQIPGGIYTKNINNRTVPKRHKNNPGVLGISRKNTNKTNPKKQKTISLVLGISRKNDDRKYVDFEQSAQLISHQNNIRTGKNVNKTNINDNRNNGDSFQKDCVEKENRESLNSNDQHCSRLQGRKRNLSPQAFDRTKNKPGDYSNQNANCSIKQKILNQNNGSAATATVNSLENNFNLKGVNENLDTENSPDISVSETICIQFDDVTNLSKNNNDQAKKCCSRVVNRTGNQPNSHPKIFNEFCGEVSKTDEEFISETYIEKIEEKVETQEKNKIAITKRCGEIKTCSGGKKPDGFHQNPLNHFVAENHKYDNIDIYRYDGSCQACGFKFNFDVTITFKDLENETNYLIPIIQPIPAIRFSYYVCLYCGESIVFTTRNNFPIVNLSQ